MKQNLVVYNADDITDGFKTVTRRAAEQSTMLTRLSVADKTKQFMSDVPSISELMIALTEKLQQKEVKQDRWGAEYVQVLIYASDLEKGDNFVSIGNNSETFRDIAIAAVTSYNKRVDNRLTIKRFSNSKTKEVWVRLYIDEKWNERTVTQYANGILKKPTRNT